MGYYTMPMFQWETFLRSADYNYFCCCYFSYIALRLEHYTSRPQIEVYEDIRAFDPQPSVHGRKNRGKTIALRFLRSTGSRLVKTFVIGRPQP